MTNRRELTTYKYQCDEKNNDMFKSQSPQHYEISEENIPNYLTFYYIKDKDTQIRYSNICQK